ncbi:hypothetical protein HKX48_007966 [Thoreauomyces humboldtii]|nr:hypothetical protein HKX48_007966 [Thoreauomyces humboldtii]
MPIERELLSKVSTDESTHPASVTVPVDQPYDAGNEESDDDDDDDDDDDAFEDAPETLSPTPDATSPRRISFTWRGKIDKKALKAATVDAERSLAQDNADVEKAVAMFLNSQFVEAETFLYARYGATLFHTLGFAVVSWLKAVMTFDPTDVQTAHEALRTALEIASVYRMQTSITGSIAGLLTRNKEGDNIKKMTPLQKHAELAYAEGHLLKAMLTLVTDGNPVAFVREGLNIRAAYSSYKSCYRFLQSTFDEGGAQKLASSGVDAHFVSGILLGVGAFNLVLSMLPGKVLKLFELIGFSGDRDFGLSRLEIGGMWPVHDRSAAVPVPASSGKKSKKDSATGSKTLQRDDSLRDDVSPDLTKVPFAMPSSSGSNQSGLRKPLCDLVLLVYHIVLSSAVQLPDCDLPFAQEILAKSLEAHPNSFIFLALRARLKETMGDPAAALEEFETVKHIQSEWKQLAHIVAWDSGTCHGALGNFPGAHDCYELLYEESKWSKAIYRYLQAVYLYASDPDANRAATSSMLKEIPSLTRKIAGKSIPMEKFVARKCRKWTLQGSRLQLPHLEILWILNGFDILPPNIIPTFIGQVDAALKKLEEQQSTTEDSDSLPYKTFYDDACLLRLLKGVLSREAAVPNASTLQPMAELARTLPPTPPQLESLAYAARQLEFTRHHAEKIALDHYLLPFSRLELGKLYVRARNFKKARREFNAALNGGYAEDEAGDRPKGKISLENALYFRVYNATIKLDMLERILLPIES